MRIRSQAGVLIFGMALAALATAQEENPNAKARRAASVTGLFEELAAPVSPEVHTEPAAVSARFVRVHFDVLGAADGPLGPPASDRGSALRLDLFPAERASFVAVLDRLEPTSPGRYAWIGHVDGVDRSSVTLIVDRAARMLTGDVNFADGVYQIRPLDNGLHAIYKLDQSRFPEDLVVEAPEPMEDAQAPPGTADDGSRIDVMAVYTPAARVAAGGTAAIENLIDLAVTETNQSYISSGIAPRIRLVFKGEVSYTESGDFTTDLNRLQNTSDGYMDTVHTLRNQYGADMVSLIIEGTQYCGIAYAIGGPSASYATSAFQVTARTCATGYYSFGHEFGHLQGARHDRYVDNTNNSPYTYNHGYYAPNNAWRTIMAYANGCNGCTRIPYWSNPDIRYGDNQAMGVAEGQTNAADNRKTLNNTAYAVANCGRRWEQRPGRLRWSPLPDRYRRRSRPTPGTRSAVRPGITCGSTVPQAARLHSSGSPRSRRTAPRPAR
jgi:hypothetical protein